MISIVTNGSNPKTVDCNLATIPKHQLQNGHNPETAVVKWPQP